MAYVINKFDGTPLVVLEDGTLDTSTSIGLLGRNYIGYGETQNENFLFLLENFANASPPSRPITGQTWFNKTTESLNVYTGTTWVPVNSAQMSETAPTATSGSLWYNTLSDQLFLYDDRWVLIAPEAIAGFGITRFQSVSILDTNDIFRPIIKVVVDDTVVAICSNQSFEINSINSIPNFIDVQAGITMALNFSFTGNLNGNASTASKLDEGSRINNVIFDGSQDITIKSNTNNLLRRGNYLLGSNFDGSFETVWSVDATSSNSIGKVVARDSAGSFSAGTVTADLIGDVTGNVTATSGTSSFDRIEANIFVGAILTGNSNSSTRLQTPRKINGINFDGTDDITVPVDGLDITGTQLSPNVVQSSITSLGILNSLIVQDQGVVIGSNGDLRFRIEQSQYPTLTVNNDQGFKISIVDARQSTGFANFEFVPSDKALMLGGPNDPTLVGDASSKTNIGLPDRPFGNIYADQFTGNATTATFAIDSTNAVNAANAVNAQFSTRSNLATALETSRTINNVSFDGTEDITIQATTPFNISTGDGLISNANFDGSQNVVISADASSLSLANKLVVRDSSGNFSANTITISSLNASTINATTVTANLIGNASTATTATQANKLTTPRTINGISFDGTQNINIPSQDLQISFGSQFTIGFTNQVGSFNLGSNYFDIFPPAGKTMSTIVGFIPSISRINFAGDVNFDDSMLCTYSFLGDRIRVWVQNTEQRSKPAANWLAIWS